MILYRCRAPILCAQNDTGDGVFRMEKKSFSTRLVDIIYIIAGAAISALSYNLFLKPHNITPGGVSGIAMIFNSVTGLLSVGSLIIIINIPLFILAWKKLGREFVALSLIGTFVLSLLIDAFSFLGSVVDDSLLASLYGGAMMGTGLGLVFIRGASTGGVDIAARLLKLKIRHLSIGKLVLFIDVAVAVAAAFVFHNLNSMLYALIGFYVSSIVMDGVIYGFDFSKVAYIISDSYEEIANGVESRLERGVTLLKGRGHYTGEEKQVLLVVIKSQQIASLRDIVKAADPEAFMIVMQAHRVVGFGFDSFDNDL